MIFGWRFFWKYFFMNYEVIVQWKTWQSIYKSVWIKALIYFSFIFAVMGGVMYLTALSALLINTHSVAYLYVLWIFKWKSYEYFNVVLQGTVDETLKLKLLWALTSILATITLREFTVLSNINIKLLISGYSSTTHFLMKYCIFAVCHPW